MAQITEEVGNETGVTTTQPTAAHVEIEINYEGLDAESRPRKKRKDSSEIWNHFTRLPLAENKGKHRSKCNYCGSTYASHPSNNGTKQLWRHFDKCPTNPNKGSKGQSLFAATTNQVLTHHLFNQERGRKAVAKYIIKDEVPFRAVEKEGLTELLQEFQPKFKMPSRWSAARDCYNIYKEEAYILKKYFKTSKVRVSFTTDCWTSVQNNYYMCLTAHWIDEHWTLQKRILNFCEIKDHKGESIAKQIEDCLFQWGIDKVFTITVDNASANDAAIAILKKRFRSWDGLVCDGDFLQMRCAAHILNLVVSEGLKEMNKSIELIRHAVKFVKSSPSRKRKFILLAERERVESKSLLTLDCPTRWNSTYLMLESAVKFVKVFTRMEEEDEEYKQYFKKKVKLDSNSDTYTLVDVLEGVDDVYDDTTIRRAESTILPPSTYDWSTAKEFLGFLKLFYNMTLKFSGSNYVTSNTCFQHIVSIQTSLESNIGSSYSLLNDMSRRMLCKFNKYWGAAEKMNPLLVVALILDPRYKLTYVKVAFTDLFHEPTKCEAMLRKIMGVLYRLYDHYSTSIQNGETSASQPTMNQGDNSGVTGVNNMLYPELELEVALSSADATYQKFLVQADAQTNVEKISEVDEYLRAELVGYRDAKFDLLAWWKGNACKYQVLSLMACDLLAVPVSTVSSEAAFSTGGRVLDAFRSSLSSKMAEALICAQNWLSMKPPNLNDFDIDNFDETAAIVIEEDAATKGEVDE